MTVAVKEKPRTTRQQVFVSVCCNCHKIEIEGEWITDERVYKALDRMRQDTHTYCPECAAAVFSKVGKSKKS